MVCARSDGVLSGSWVHVPRPPRFHTRVFQPFRSRFPLHWLRDLSLSLPCILAIRNLICWCSSRSTAWAYPSQRTASPYRLGFTFCTEPAYSRRLLYSRSVPIFRINLWWYARRITMAMAIAAPPPIWCIPTLSIAAQCFVLILKDSSGDLCRLVTPYKFLLLLCKVVYRTEIVKASRAASR